MSETLIPRDAPFIEGARYSKSYKTDPASKLDLYVIDPRGDTIRKHGRLLRSNNYMKTNELKQKIDALSPEAKEWLHNFAQQINDCDSVGFADNPKCRKECFDAGIILGLGRGRYGLGEEANALLYTKQYLATPTLEECPKIDPMAISDPAPPPKTAEAFYRDLLEQIAADPRRTRARRLAESGLLFWDSMRMESTAERALP